jgi:hypothetical protein
MAERIALVSMVGVCKRLLKKKCFWWNEADDQISHFK